MDDVSKIKSKSKIDTKDNDTYSDLHFKPYTCNTCPIKDNCKAKGLLYDENNIPMTQKKIDEIEEIKILESLKSPALQE